MTDFVERRPLEARLARRLAGMFADIIVRCAEDGGPLSERQLEQVGGDLFYFFAETMEDIAGCVRSIPAPRVQPSEHLRRLVLERDEHRCRKCGAEDSLQLDHVLPVAQGGETTLGNLQILCARCNLEKSAQAVRYV